MKNFTFTAIFATFCFAASAQTVVDFESLPLTTPETFYNGSDEAGFFATQGVRFENSYTVAYSSWSGFAYSNTTDVTTAGFTNQYSAFPGSGANSSSKYGVFAQAGKLTFQGVKVIVDSLKVTNTTYAGISMRDGDAYAKKFGSINGADNLPDGTDGKDFFKLWIFGLDSNNLKTDSVSFFLADFTSNNATEHYILNTWKNVSLTSLGSVYGLSFEFESTDNGIYGMNTPAYFALDNMAYKTSTLSTKEIAQNEFAVYPNPFTSELNVKGGNGDLTITDLTGKVVYTASHVTESTIDLSFLNQGMYVISVNNKGAISTKMIKK
ncbi:MAG: DUF4465 domain-containing protein [Crocinitomicaceae bacterium]|nr:DUF4465 domain-containing protein [Crocinitomicaceae bacterium]